MQTLFFSARARCRTWLPLLAGLACSAPPSAPQSSAAEPTPPVSVVTEAAAKVSIPKVLRLTGSLRGNREAEVAANANGRVVSIAVERGDTVKQGQVLSTVDIRAASLSAEEAKAQAASARAQEEQARAECERYTKLRDKGAMTDLEFEQKMAQCRTLPLTAQAASARAALAAQTVGDSEIRAPFAGVVADRHVQVGQYLRQDSRVVTLVALDPIRLEFAVPEAEIGHLKEGATVRFRVSAYPQATFEATVRYVSAVIRRDTRDLVVEALTDNKDQKLLPGMFAEVELAVGQQEVVGVPSRAIAAQDGRSRLFVLQGGRLEERLVALGPVVGERAAVLKGVAVGERVVTSETAGLSNGQQAQ